MALRWVDKGLGTEHGFLGGTRLFVLLGPVEDGDGKWTLSSDLPGAVSGNLVSKRFDNPMRAKMRAHVHMISWLHIMGEQLAVPPESWDGETYWDQGPRPGVLPAQVKPTPGRCESMNDGSRCELNPGHRSSHTYGGWSWS